MGSKVVSIEISDSVTRICEMSYGKKKPLIYKSVIFDNPELVVEDGFIMDRNAYGTILRQQLASAGIKCRDAVFSLTSNKIISREVLIPIMKPELIPALIESESTEYFPMDTTGHIFTYSILNTDKQAKQMRIMVYAAPEILIKNYQALAAENDLKPVAIDYSGNTMYQWLAHSASDMQIYLQINEQNTMMTILENKVFALQRNMNFGTAHLVQNLLDERYYTNIDSDEAFLKIRNNRLIYASYNEMMDYVADTQEDARLHDVKVRMTEAIRPLIANISRVLEYYTTKNRDAKISKIYIGGSGAGVNGLAPLLESEFQGIEFEICSMLPGVNISRANTVCQERSSEFISCIGASVKTINFCKIDEKKEKNKTLIFAVCALVLVIGASVFIVLNGKNEYDETIAKKKNYENKVAELEATGIEQLEAKANAATVRVMEISGMDASTIHANEIWNDALSYLESEGVSNMVVTSLSSNDSGLVMNVTVNKKEEVARLLLQLKKIPYFSDVSINGITEEKDEELNLTQVSFSVLCSYDTEYITHVLYGEEGEEEAE